MSKNSVLCTPLWAFSISLAISLCLGLFIGLQDVEDDLVVLGNTMYATEVTNNDKVQIYSYEEMDKNPMTLQHVHDDNVETSSPRQRFIISREDGLDNLKKDILGC